MQVSIFDLDHTLLRVNSSFAFGLYLYRQKFMSLSTLMRCLMNYMRHKYGDLSIRSLHQKIFSILFNNKSSTEIQLHVEKFLKLNFNDIGNDPAIKRLEEARQRGDYLVILSASPNFLVKPIAQLFYVNEWEATNYSENSNSDLSSISSICEGEDKASYIKLLADRLDISLSYFTMYSDSYLDLPAMNIVGKAIGVSPDRKLRKICKRNGWEIL